jgi:hypothetical protein
MILKLNVYLKKGKRINTIFRSGDIITYKTWEMNLVLPQEGTNFMPITQKKNLGSYVNPLADISW